jgi:outer membrane immunogenic protein
MGAVMKKLLLSGVACTALAVAGASAHAADMPLKTPPVAPPVYSWTGFYVGANVGYSWGRSDSAYAFAVQAAANAAAFSALNAGASNRVDGIIGGLQAGYDWQIRSFVLGIETDAQLSGQSGTGNLNAAFPPFATSVGFLPNPVAIASTTKLTWLGTTRGRIGFASERWLVYATGGLAYGEVSMSGVAVPAVAIGPNPPFAWTSSTTKLGWTIGAGIEAALAGNWTWKLEYLYADLGHVSAATVIPPGCVGTPAACIPTAGGSGSITARFADNIVRIGLNYRFSDPALVARY